MGRKGPTAKTKIVLKSVSIGDQLGSMPNLKFQTFLNKNPPNVLLSLVRLALVLQTLLQLALMLLELVLLALVLLVLELRCYL